MPRAKLEEIINHFRIEDFTQFFRLKNEAQGNFRPSEEKLPNYNDADFSGFIKLGQIEFSKTEKLVIIGANVAKDLSERSGKKAQYEKGKRVLRSSEFQQFNAGIFIFYDKNGNFRFSLIYDIPKGNRRDWNNFRRFTYFVSREFTNKTFLQRIGDGGFSSLEKIKDAFSVEKVTKDFYKDIANWYFWTVQSVKFPDDVEKEENGRNIAVIRLITRLIFIWFMKERGLVQNVLFEQSQVARLLKDLSAGKTTYYKAILQNLFFSTLNTDVKDRKYRFQKSFQGRNVAYMDHSIYRYENYFSDSKNMLSVFKNIPFLNGGLFDCLDRRAIENGKNIEVRIDGFTDKDVGLHVPNFLFYTELVEADLNQEYGTKNKKYKVRGIINILSTYNFTIDENDTNDQEVALDPELLGKVFENLLASFNPETASTARKATGSYYTPREIVDYMVTQSLKNYLITNLDGIEELDNKLERLLSTTEETNPFNREATLKIVKLIDDLRIVDPAVGSGAFPMGVLNKLVLSLAKLDPNNTLWKETQHRAVELSVTDPILKKKLKDQITEQFSEKNFDYGRKLYLIQKCLYGVDIQQIAVEIAKLRFFISLLVDEKIDKTKENWGIEPLPNLDYKIMQGNSLLEEYEGIKLFDEGIVSASPLDNTKQIEEINQKVSKLQREFFKLHSAGELKGVKKQQIEAELKKYSDWLNKLTKAPKVKADNGSLFDQFSQAKQKSDELKKLHQEFFETANKREKDEIKKQIEVLEWELIEATLREKNKLSLLPEIERFKKANIKPFFLWKLNFSEVFEKNGGFDIVIANPPWVFAREGDFEDSLKKHIVAKFLANLVGSQTGRAKQSGKINLFAIFILQSLRVLKNSGFLTYIIPNTLLRATVYDSVRKLLLDNYRIILIVDLSSGVFGNVTASTIVLAVQNEKSDLNHKVKIIDDISKVEDTDTRKISQDSFLKNISFTFNIYTNEKINNLLQKMQEASDRLDTYFDILAGGIATGPGKKKYIADKPLNGSYKPLVEGKDIGKYKVNFKNKFILYDRKKLYRAREEYLFLSPEKLITQRIGGGKDPLIVAYDDRQFYTFNSTNSIFPKENQELSIKFLLALLNSRLLNWYYTVQFTNKSTLTVNISKTFLEQLPIRRPTPDEEKGFVDLVNKILVSTGSNDYFDNSSKQLLVKENQQQIDRLVYKLYGLTLEEIKIVEEGGRNG